MKTGPPDREAGTSLARFVFCLLCLFVAIPAKAQTLTVPIEIRNGSVFVQVSINDNKALLLLDTGASNTIVSPQVARANQSQMKTVIVTGAASRSTVSSALLEVQLGNQRLGFNQIVLMDLQKEQHRTLGAFDGLLGCDILRNFSSMRIDYQHKVLELKL